MDDYSGYGRCDSGYIFAGDIEMKELFETLAAIEHERWADWQKYVHSLCWQERPDRVIFLKLHFDNWQRQINTPYSELSEKEKDSDREQVMRYWPLIEELLGKQSN